jgi:hypothetical protein
MMTSAEHFRFQGLCSNTEEDSMKRTQAITTLQRRITDILHDRNRSGIYPGDQ